MITITALITMVYGPLFLTHIYNYDVHNFCFYIRKGPYHNRVCVTYQLFGYLYFNCFFIVV